MLGDTFLSFLISNFCLALSVHVILLPGCQFGQLDAGEITGR